MIKKESVDLNLKELKDYTNRKLPAGDSASFGYDDGAFGMEIYDGDVMLMHIPLDGLSQEQAIKRIDNNLRGFEYAQ